MQCVIEVLHTETHTHTHTHTYTQARTHANTHTHIHTHTHARARERQPLASANPSLATCHVLCTDGGVGVMATFTGRRPVDKVKSPKARRILLHTYRIFLSQERQTAVLAPCPAYCVQCWPWRTIGGLHWPVTLWTIIGWSCHDCDLCGDKTWTIIGWSCHGNDLRGDKTWIIIGWSCHGNDFCRNKRFVAHYTVTMIVGGVG